MKKSVLIFAFATMFGFASYASVEQNPTQTQTQRQQQDQRQLDQQDKDKDGVSHKQYQDATLQRDTTNRQGSGTSTTRQGQSGQMGRDDMNRQTTTISVSELPQAVQKAAKDHDDSEIESVERKVLPTGETVYKVTYDNSSLFGSDKTKSFYANGREYDEDDSDSDRSSGTSTRQGQDNVNRQGTGAAMGTSQQAGRDSQKINVTDLPQSVRKAAMDHEESNIESVEKKVLPSGETIYKVTYDDASLFGSDKTKSFHADGKEYDEDDASRQDSDRSSGTSTWQNQDNVNRQSTGTTTGTTQQTGRDSQTSTINVSELPQAVRKAAMDHDESNIESVERKVLPSGETIYKVTYDDASLFGSDKTKSFYANGREYDEDDASRQDSDRSSGTSTRQNQDNINRQGTGTGTGTTRQGQDDINRTGTGTGTTGTGTTRQGQDDINRTGTGTGTTGTGTTRQDDVNRTGTGTGTTGTTTTRDDINRTGTGTGTTGTGTGTVRQGQDDVNRQGTGTGTTGTTRQGQDTDTQGQFGTRQQGQSGTATQAGRDAMDQAGKEFSAINVSELPQAVQKAAMEHDESNIESVERKVLPSGETVYKVKYENASLFGSDKTKTFYANGREYDEDDDSDDRDRD